MGKFIIPMRHLLSAYFTLTCTLIFAQTLPNAGFENWTACQIGAEPIPFQTSNLYSALTTGTLTTEQSTDAHGGMYAAYLHADAVGDISGLMTLGQDLMTGSTPTIDFNGTPDSISFWAKYTISDIDFGSVMITLYEDGNEVGFGIVTFNETVSTYTYHSAAIEMQPGASPNGMTLSVSSGGDASLGGELYIDDLHVIYNSGSGDDIPGGDFENWNVTTTNCLDNWASTNAFTSPEESVSPGEPHSGTHSVRITNRPTLFGTGSLGYILLGDPNADFCSEPSFQVPLGQAVTTIGGYYKYTAGNANEMASVFISFTATDDIGGCDSIYEVFQYLPATNDWTQFAINVPPDVILEWENEIAPQYLTLGFISTVISNEDEPNGDPNSVLLVDDLELNYTNLVGIDNATPHSEANLFPNPAHDILHVQMPSAETTIIQLVDATGNIVHEFSSNSARVSIQTEQFPSGVYTLRLKSRANVSAFKILLAH
jgi:hypothetical protein